MGINHFLLLVYGLLWISFKAHAVSKCNIEAIYQLGDSTSDTGNFIRLIGPNAMGSYAGRLPYGETFGKPTGRFCDGLLIVDYFAKSFMLPLLNPIEAMNESFQYGANFAVAGSTVLSTSFFAARNVTTPFPPDVPLREQLDQFKTILNSTSQSPAGVKERLAKSLMLIGEMGSNDFLYPFMDGKSIGEVKTYVPFVVQETINVARELIRFGALRIVIFGDYPVGCTPLYLTRFQSGNPSDYDSKGCLIAFNNFVKYRNSYIQGEIAKLRLEYPNATIVYGDEYNTFMFLLNNAHILGFDASSTLKACCGGGGKYNYNTSIICGSQGYNLCPNPSSYLSWDGIHLTQQTHRYITKFILDEILLKLCLT